MLVVLVTEPEFRRAEPVFTAAAGMRCIPAPIGDAELARAVADSGARAVVVGFYPYPAAIYQALPRGGVIARFGVGHDGVDKTKATAAGVLCTNTPGVLDQSVAEHAMLLILAAARHLARNASDMRAGIWDIGPPGVEVRGKTLAVIGCGRIGRATARIASQGFGMRAIGVRRSAGGDAGPDADFAHVTTQFEAAVRDAHYVSLHINAEAGNRRFLNAERLALLSPHAWVVNTARGAVLDEQALYEALADRRIAGAALDVFEREPYVPLEAARDLRQLPNVILTPHVGSHTLEANRAMAERALENIRRAEAGDFGGMDLLNPDALHPRH